MRAYRASYAGRFPPRDEDLLVALRWAINEADGRLGDVLVVAPTKLAFEENQVLRQLPRGIRQESSRTLGFRGARVVLAVWLPEKDLDKVDGLPGVEAICVVPWLRDEIESWRKARQAIDLLGSQPTESPTLSDPVVEAAMRSLTGSVNVSTGLLHPMDRPKAIHAFRILKAGGHTWDPQSVKAWAMANGWPARHADHLAEIARGVLEGKAYKAGRNAWAVDILAQWRGETPNRDSSEIG